jgi:mono/diheme cytochrome c family protein
MMKFLFGVVVGLCLLLLAGYLFLTRGISMGTSGRPLPGERFVTSRAITNSIGKSAQEQSPLPADETNLLAGADIYQHNGCANCHGRLDQPASGMGGRFYPRAPHLLPPGKGVTDDPVGTTHWVVKNGIRFSGMPTFGAKLTDNQIWQVSLLLHEADKLPAPVQDALRK